VGEASGSLYEDGRDRNFPIKVRLSQEYRQSFDAIRRITIGAPNPGGNGVVQIPLTDVASVTLTSGASFIYREGQQRYIPIKFSVRGRDLGGGSPGGPTKNCARRAIASWLQAGMGRRIRRVP